MNFQWLNNQTPCPVVEFHDIRCEKFRTDKYLALVEDRLAVPLSMAGVSPLGQFRVENHPERVILVRGFASMPARRRALTEFHAGEAWAAHRRTATDLVRDESVMLTRSIRPEEGIRPIRPGEPVTALISEVRFAEQIGNYHLWLRLFLRKAGLGPLASFATLEHVNDVPAVPVVRHRSQHIALLPSGGGVPALPTELRNMLRFPPETLRLEPAASLVW
jgi:hypothetical protein